MMSVEGRWGKKRGGRNHKTPNRVAKMRQRSMSHKSGVTFVFLG